MIWDVIEHSECTIYKNRDIDLVVKVYDEDKDKKRICMNYKGYNLTVPMLVWEFGEDLELASIEDVHLGGENSSNQYFIVNNNDEENFLNEMYFFLVDNDMSSVCSEKYKI